jgi:predicted transcriptional regulator
VILTEIFVKPIHDDLSSLMERVLIIAYLIFFKVVDAIGYLKSKGHWYFFLRQHVGSSS